MIKWMRPSGTEIETNDHPDTVAEAKRLGWKKAVKRKPRKQTDGNSLNSNT